MIRVDVIRMAGDAGLTAQQVQAFMAPLERLVDLAQAAEREECAKLCADLGHDANGYGCAADIRARSTT